MDISPAEFPKEWVDCGFCNGTGQLDGGTCPACSGKGGSYETKSSESQPND